MAPARRPIRGLGDALDDIIGRYFRREPKQSRSRALVDAVVQATDDLIRRGEPIEQVTVERVSDLAGVGIGSFYEYFSSKDSVLGVLIGKITRSISTISRASWTRSITARSTRSSTRSPGASPTRTSRTPTGPA